MKKNIFRVISLILSFVTVMVLSGCSLNFFSIESMLSAPALTGKNGQVQKAFNELMSSAAIKLKTPVKGEYRSSFILKDLNNNGQDEALVFYSDSSVDTSVRLCLLEYVNKTWVISSDIKGAGNGVYSVEFSDFNDDGIYEILVGWSLFENKTARNICVYSVEKGEKGLSKFNTLLNENYTAHNVADFNNDGFCDLSVVYIDDTAESSRTKLRVFSFSGASQMFMLSECKLKGSAVSVSDINYDTVKIRDNDVTRLIIDFNKNDNSMFTDIVYWSENSKKVVSVFDNPNVTTLRALGLSSYDIDGDAKYEIPITEKVNKFDTEISAAVGKETYSFVKIRWINSLGDNSDEEILTVFNPIHNYLFKVKNDDELTVRFDVYKNSLVFYNWNGTDNSVGSELFSVSFVPDTEENYQKDALLLYEDINGKFYYEITEKGKEKFNITDDYIKSSFIKQSEVKA